MADTWTPENDMAWQVEMAELHDEIERLRRSALHFRPGTESPDTPKRSARTHIVTVRRGQARNGRDLFTFAACYLNEYPLEWDGGDGCGECPDDDSHADGCPITGWMTDRFSVEYDEYYEPLLSPGDTLVEWAALPDRSNERSMT